ncbi:MAG: hypothetical protein GF401_11415 [Chitinivibrionales bacterium]|nr:hypothetical protein [Chitinivibrionales bacterium]
MTIEFSWAALIRQVFKVHPLVCPRCGGKMRIVAFIEQAAVIETILPHGGKWEQAPFFKVRKKARGKVRFGLTKTAEIGIFPDMSQPGGRVEKQLHCMMFLSDVNN